LSHVCPAAACFDGYEQAIIYDARLPKTQQNSPQIICVSEKA